MLGRLGGGGGGGGVARGSPRGITGRRESLTFSPSPLLSPSLRGSLLKRGPCLIDHLELLIDAIGASDLAMLGHLD